MADREQFTVGELTIDGRILTKNDNSALFLGAGTADLPETTSVANKNFLEFRTETTTTTAGSDTRGMYLRLYINGVSTGGGEALRAFTTVEKAIGTAHGAHISLNFDDTNGVVSGQGIAGRNTLHIPDNASWAPGTIAALQAEIYSDGAASDTDGATEVSFLRCINGGHSNGIADVDDDAFFLTISGGSTASGNMFAAKSSAAVSHVLRCKIHGTVYYLMVSNQI